jgi:phosphoribosylformylglycinamidine synthase
MEAVCRANRKGLVRSCHDLSEGGLAVAAAEMAFAGGVGLAIDLSAVPLDGSAALRRDDVLLFSESNSRFLVEVRPDNAAAFEAEFNGTAVARIGKTDASSCFVATGLDGREVVRAELSRLKSAWQTPLFPGHDE